MEIKIFNFHNLRNAAHYQFQTDFVAMVERYEPKTLGIEEIYAVYKPKYLNEGIALVSISKSATSEQIEIADKGRDSAYRCIVDDVRSKEGHFMPEVKEAAKRVLVILDRYGNLAPKPNDEESGLITSLIDDLRTKAAADLVTLSNVEWIDELERLNDAFIALEASRNSEEANRTELRMKQVRVEVDAAYKKIEKRINALIELNGEEPYAKFVKELNARITRAQESIAISRAKKKTTEAQKAE